MAKLVFYGGVEKITGTNILVQFSQSKILLDCGLIQGQNICELENFLPFEYDPQSIDFVLISHAHIDHIGRLPKLFKEGFRGTIYSVKPTKDLAREMLLDSIELIKETCQKFNKSPIYEEKDLEAVFASWQIVDYYEEIKLKDINVKFYNSGHILGSAFIEIQFDNKKLIYSGDLGNYSNPILKNPDPLPETDYLILESTYGNRNHEDLNNRDLILEKIVEDVIYQQGTLIIPSFALERTQDIISELINLIDKKKVPSVEIYLYSPLAVNINKIYLKYSNYLQEYERDLFNKFLKHKKLKMINRLDEEKNIFDKSKPKVIISGSGMLSGGPILNVLKHYITDPKTAILFIGYQAENSLGRKLLEGEKIITIDNESYSVKASIKSLFSFSNHMDQSMMLNWISPRRFTIREIFLFHGDSEVKEIFKHKIIDTLGIRVSIPRKGEIFEL